MFQKRSKNSRHRGSWTHGYGEKKKHRGAGSRGGRGMAGSGKRADTKKPSISHNTKYFGKHGFTPIQREVVNAINVSTIASNIQTYVDSKIAVKDGQGYKVDLTKTKYSKLLAGGSVTIPLHVTVESASQKAIEKLNKANGSVTVTEN
ncbi:MAG: uL15m family ribosomal protein [Candidatus Woesearchaeota archaeon]